MGPTGDLEFPGGGSNIDPLRLPEHDVIVPGARPAQANPVDQRFMSLQRQYQQYGEGCQASRDILAISG